MEKLLIPDQGEISTRRAKYLKTDEDMSEECRILLEGAPTNQTGDKGSTRNNDDMMVIDYNTLK